MKKIIISSVFLAAIISLVGIGIIGIPYNKEVKVMLRQYDGRYLDEETEIYPSNNENNKTTLKRMYSEGWKIKVIYTEPKDINLYIIMEK